MIERTFQYGFRLRLHRKDLAITLQTGRERRLPLMAPAQAGQLMDALLAQGMGDLDHSAWPCWSSRWREWAGNFERGRF